MGPAKATMRPETDRTLQTMNIFITCWLFLFLIQNKVVHSYNSSTWEVEREKPGVQCHLWLHSKFETNPGYISPCFLKVEQMGFH